MSFVLKKIAQTFIDTKSKDELSKMSKKWDFTPKADAVGDMYDNRSDKFGKDQSPPIPKDEYVHRSILIRKGYVHFTNILHRQMVAYYHPWVKGYLEKVGKALWSTPPLFIRPEHKDDEKEDEIITQFWEDNQLQAMVRKSWHKAQVHGINFYFPMDPKGFFQGYSGPPWYVYSTDELGQPGEYIQGHPVRWSPVHSNSNKTYPTEILITQGVFYDYKNSDDFVGEPFGIGIWDLLIDWIWIEDSVNSFDQRMGNGFLTMVVPNNTSPTDIAKYESVIKKTRTEKGIVIKGAVDEPVELNWVGMAGMQVDFIGHMEKLEDLIAFNMGFPKRWIMGDAEGAMESSGKDHLEVNIQLKNLFAEWTIFIKRVLMYHNLIDDLKDIIIKVPVEMQLSEQEQVELDSIKVETLAVRMGWMTPDEIRNIDDPTLGPIEGGDTLYGPQQEADNPENPKPATASTKVKKDTYEQLEEIFTNSDKITIRELAEFTGLSTGSMSRARAKFDTTKNPAYKEDEVVIKCDAVQLDDDIYEINDVPLILPQTKHYENLGYKTTRPREEIARIFNDPKYPKEFRIGATITDDHRSRVGIEVLNENTVGMVKLTRIDEDGNARGNIRYSLKEADRILGKDNFIREKTLKNENINTSVALYSKDRPTKNGMLERDLDIRSFIFSNKKARNKKAGM